MTIATTNTVVDHTTDAGFRTWVQEIITQLVTILGMTQTADTGQINTTTVTRPAINTSGGYVILRFNDAAQATAPIFIKLEFGSANPIANPQMWITLANGSNGAGTLTGLITTRVAACQGALVGNTGTPVISRFCYNTTVGFLGLVWKINGNTAASNIALGGFFIYRSADNTGTVTTDAVHLLTNSASVTGTTSQAFLQAISYLNTAVYAAAPSFPSNAWGTFPFSLQVTLFGTQASLGPIFQFTPIPGITPWAALALNTEFGIGTTTVTALVGTTTHTFISVGSGFGNTNLTGLSYGINPATPGSLTMVMLWE